VEKMEKMEKRLNLPYTKEKLKAFNAGDSVLISGTIYTARDEAHKRLIEMIGCGEKLPFDIDGAILYYAGPTPEKPGYPIGSVGPTTSYRMDAYAPMLLDLGQAAMIGKGERSAVVSEAIVRNGAVYFAAIGGVGALIANSVINAEIVAFEDLGAEAIRRLSVVDFPVTVVIDSAGNDLYQLGRKEYLAKLGRKEYLAKK